MIGVAGANISSQTLLACVHAPAQIDEHPTLPVLLAELDREQLPTLPVRLVERQPEVSDIIEGVVQRLRTEPWRLL